MSALRVKELKGTAGKKPSRKAVKAGRAGDSPMASLLNSPVSSAAPSRATSDVSEADHSDSSEDETAILAAGSDPDDISELLEQLQDRKHHTSEMHEKYLGVYIAVLRSRYSEETHDWLDLAAQPLVSVFLKDANRAPTASERLLNLQAYYLTISIARNLDVFDSAKTTLKQILLEDDDDDCRVHAIYAICATTIFSSAGAQDAVLETMNYFCEIIQTTGDSVEAFDNSQVVVAALQGWSFVASYCDELSQFADVAMDPMVEQLESNDLEVQAAAASSIAFIFEASRQHQGETDQPFELPFSPHRLLPKILELNKMTAKSVSRKNRRALREELASVATSLERGVGPGYSTALTKPGADGDVEEFGHRKTLRLNREVALIDTWALEVRISMLRIIFRSSLSKHINVNDNVIESLELADFQTLMDAVQRKTAPRKKPGRRSVMTAGDE